jgi:hypothetical protein
MIKSEQYVRVKGANAMIQTISCEFYPYDRTETSCTVLLLYSLQTIVFFSRADADALLQG